MYTLSCTVPHCILLDSTELCSTFGINMSRTSDILYYSVQHSKVLYSTSMLLDSSVHFTVLYYTLLYPTCYTPTTLYFTVLYSTTIYNTIQHWPTMYNTGYTGLYSSVLYCTVLYLCYTIIRHTSAVQVYCTML